MRVYGDEVLEKNDDTRSERGAKQRSSASQSDHEKHLHRSCELKIHRAYKAVVVGPQHAGKTAKPARDHKADILVQPHVITECSHAGFALSDSDQGLAERGTDDHAKNPVGDEKSGQREIVKRNRKSERPRKTKVRPWNCGNAVVPLGHRRSEERRVGKESRSGGSRE